MTIRRLIQITGILIIYLFINNNSSSGQQFLNFPIDHAGNVLVQVIGNMVEVSGTWEYADPPDWEDLISYSLPTCATVRMVEEWNCGNPSRHGARSLFFYFRFEVTFPPKCHDNICFFAKGHDEYGHVCIDGKALQYTAKVELRDQCDHNILYRGIGHAINFVDIGENARPWAKLESRIKTVFPYEIFGHFYVGGVEVWMAPMYWHEGDSTHATYLEQDNSWKVWMWLNGDTLSGDKDVQFSVPYSRNAQTTVKVGQAGFTIDDVIFQDTLAIYPMPGQKSVCYPQGSVMKLGASLSMKPGYELWPPDCETLEGQIKAYKHGTDSLLVTTQVERIVRPHFTTDFFESCYEIHGFQDLQMQIDWKGTVGIYPTGERRVGPTDPLMQFHIFHAFRADTVIFPGHPTQVLVGDTVEVSANPYPFLKQQNRIQYSWQIDNSRMAHFRFGYPGYFSIYQNNYLIIDSTGEFRVRYIVKDTVSANAFCDTSEYKVVNVGTWLVISSPRKDTTYWISEKPEMPQIKCRAQIANLDTASQRNLDFYWKMVIKHKTDSLVIRDTVTGVHDWIPNWGTTFMGDFVTLDAGVKYGTDSLVAHIVHNDSLRILGKNPTEDSAKAYLRKDYEDPDRARQAEVIGLKESGYKQFTDGGLPKKGGHGYGMMQLDTPPPTRNDLWNWKTNVDHGKDLLQTKWVYSNGWFDDCVRNKWPVPTTTNRLYDTYCRYNGGNYYSNVTDTLNNKIYVRNTAWVDSCGVCRTGQPEWERNKLDNKCKQSGCCYADDAMSIH